MKYVKITDLDATDLMRLIDEGERFYVSVTGESSILSEPNPSADRDTFWFYEAPRARKPIRKTVEGVSEENVTEDR